MERIVRHCLEKNPEERFHSAHDLAFDLQALSADSSRGTGPAPPLRNCGGEGRSLSRGPASALVAGVILAALAATVLAPALRRAAPHVPEIDLPRGYVWTARFAPDGQTIVYGASWEGQPVEIFTTRAESPESRALGIGSADILSISKSGDLAVSLDRHFTTGWETVGTLAQVPLSGGAPREILENVSEADWAPNGKTLAVVHEVAGKYRLEFPPGKVLYETAGWIRLARVSPKGDRIAFVDLPTHGDNTGPLAVVDLSGKKTKLSDRGGQGLAWSPSGNEVWVSGGCGPEGGLARRRRESRGPDPGGNPGAGPHARRQGPRDPFHHPARDREPLRPASPRNGISPGSIGPSRSDYRPMAGSPLRRAEPGR